MAEERKAAVVVVAVDMSEHAQKALECEYNVVHACISQCSVTN